MSTLLRSALIIDPQSAHHGKKRDVLLRNGNIVGISAKISEPRAREVKATGLTVSPGWIDLRANFREPGDEHKETLLSGARAARAGGFTRVVLMPDTRPRTDNRTAVEFLRSRGKDLPVTIHPVGAVSVNCEGRQLAELFDMHSAGAVGFTDDKHPVSTELMVRALDYTHTFGGLVMTFPFDPGVNPGSMMHEGPTSTSLGLRGNSALSEELRLHRDIRLLAYCGGRMHVSLISTAGSVDLIRKAKKEGLRITCGVAAHQLIFTDEDLTSFDSNLKVLPPFRSKADQRALIAGLADGTIDAICSDHSPEDHEHKVLEWEYSSNGISSIQTTAAVAWQAVKNKLDVGHFVQKLTSGPASVLGISCSLIEEGMPAELTAFSTRETQRVDPSEWQSKSVNSPFIGMNLPLRVFPLD